MNKFSEKIIEKIKIEGISPRPKWEFLLKDSVLWFGFALSVLMGGISVSLIMFLVMTGDLDIYKDLYGSVFSALAFVVPFFWLLVLIIFIIGAYLNYRFTDSGYRFKYIYVLLLSLVMSFFVGAFIFHSGMAKWLHFELTEKMPFYDNMHPGVESIWMKPEKGFLTGVIISKKSEYEIEVLTPDVKIWVVNIENAKVPKKMPLDLKIMIKILGKKLSDNSFEAYEIRPLERPFKNNPLNFERKMMMKPY